MRINYILLAALMGTLTGCASVDFNEAIQQVDFEYGEFIVRAYWAGYGFYVGLCLSSARYERARDLDKLKNTTVEHTINFVVFGIFFGLLWPFFIFMIIGEIMKKTR